MAEQKKRIINLTEKTAPTSGDFFAVDSQAGGTKKVPTTALAKASDLTAEAAARTQADNALTSAINSASALIQNPTKTLSGALVSFADGANMPMVACTAEIVPKQSGTGTPSPDNVRPISGWESVSVTDAGKNLCLLPNASGTGTSLLITTTDEPSITFDGTRSGSATITTISTISLPAGTYILSGAVNNDSCGLQIYNETQNRVYRDTTGNGVTITVNEGDVLKWRGYVGANAVADNMKRYPLLRLASDTDPTYEPYTGTTHTTDLGRTVYGGTLDVVSGVLTVDKEYRDLGTINWTRNASLDIFISDGITNGATTKPAGYETAICSNYATYYTGSAIILSQIPNNNIVFSTSSASSTPRFVLKDTRYTDGSALKTALSGAIAVFPLATPQTYTLTGQEVETLLGDNNVWADSGDVEITYRRDISIVLENLENAING